MEKRGTRAESSEMVLSAKAEVEEEGESLFKTKNKVDTKEKFRPWASRFKCYAAYVCSISSYLAFQKNCMVLSSGGLLIFIPFILIRIFVGIPIVIILVALARYIMTGPANIWSMHALSRGVLACEIAGTAYFIVNSLIITTYLITYFFLSFTIPWSVCSPEWASPACFENGRYNDFFNKCVSSHSEAYCNNLKWEVSGLEYWKYVAASDENTQTMGFNFLYLFGSIVFVFIIIIKGIPSAEKAFFLLAIVSFVLAPFTAFLICLTPEMHEGIKKVFFINWSELSNGGIWVLTYEAVLFALGIGRLAVGFVSSHANFEEDIFSDILVICFTDIYFCLLLTFPIVCVLHEINLHEYGFDTAGGLGVFIALSEIILLFPSPQHLWSVFLYSEMILMSFGSIIVSMIALVETVISFAKEHFTTFYTSLILCIIWLFLCTIFFFYDFNFSVVLDGAFIGIAFLYIFVLAILYGFQRFLDDFHFMMGYPVPFFLKFSWLTSMPASLTMIILHGILFNTYHFVLAVPFIIFVLTAFAEVGLHIYRSKPYKDLFKTNPDWGPADPLLRKSRILFDSRAVTKEFTYRQELQEKPNVKPPDISEQAVVQVI